MAAVLTSLANPVFGDSRAPVWRIIIDDRSFRPPFPGTEWMEPIYKRFEQRVQDARGTLGKWALFAAQIQGPLATLPPIWATQTLLEVFMCVADSAGGRHLMYFDSDAAPGLTFSIAELADWAKVVAASNSAAIGAGAHMHDMCNAGWLLLPGTPCPGEVAPRTLPSWIRVWATWCT